ncbi:hypothetical protein ACVPQ8_19605 [Salmonella enterica subsp. enterica serovar Enteritidis]
MNFLQWRTFQERISVIDPGELLYAFARILKKLIGKGEQTPKRSHKDPGRSLRFTWQSV